MLVKNMDANPRLVSVNLPRKRNLNSPDMDDCIYDHYRTPPLQGRRPDAIAIPSLEWWGKPCGLPVTEPLLGYQLRVHDEHNNRPAE